MEVLDGGVTAFAIGKNVAEMERQVADDVRQGGGHHGELRLVGALPRGRVARPPAGLRGDHLHAHVLHRHLLDRARRPRARARRRRARHVQHRRRQDRRARSRRRRVRSCSRTSAGTRPDWDAVRAIADQHNLLVVEDSCDALGHTLRGTPTGSAPTSASPASPTRTSSRARGTVAWSCSTTRTSATAACCSAGGAVAPKCSSTAHARATATSGKTSTASTTTTCSSSTSSAGTSSRRRWVRRSVSSSSRSCRSTHAAPAQLRDVQRVLRAARRPHHPAAPDPRARHRVAVLPDHRAPRRRLHPQRRAALPRGARASTPARCGRATRRASR